MTAPDLPVGIRPPQPDLSDAGGVVEDGTAMYMGSLRPAWRVIKVRNRMSGRQNVGDVAVWSKSGHHKWVGDAGKGTFQPSSDAYATRLDLAEEALRGHQPKTDSPEACSCGDNAGESMARHAARKVVEALDGYAIKFGTTQAEPARTPTAKDRGSAEELRVPVHHPDLADPSVLDLSGRITVGALVTYAEADASWPIDNGPLLLSARNVYLDDSRVGLVQQWQSVTPGRASTTPRHNIEWLFTDNSQGVYDLESGSSMASCLYASIPVLVSRAQ